jgi:hypothetical protein
MRASPPSTLSLPRASRALRTTVPPAPTDVADASCHGHAHQLTISTVWAVADSYLDETQGIRYYWLYTAKAPSTSGSTPMITGPRTCTRLLAARMRRSCWPRKRIRPARTNRGTDEGRRHCAGRRDRARDERPHARRLGQIPWSVISAGVRSRPRERKVATRSANRGGQWPIESTRASGRLGGTATSPAKAAASRANGKKGGRASGSDCAASILEQVRRHTPNAVCVSPRSGFSSVRDDHAGLVSKP